MENTESISTGLSEAEKNAKTHAIVAYGLMLLGFFTGISFLAGGIWAMVKKSDAQGTVFADHYDNIIKTFWVSIVLSIVGFLTVVFVVGYVVLLVAFVYTLWKLIAGLAKVTSDKSFN